MIEPNVWACSRCAAPQCELGRCTGCSNISPHIQKVTTPLLYQGVVKELIQHWKFHNRPELTDLLLKEALAHQSQKMPCADVVCAIPMHWYKRLARGYNQSQVLARALVRHVRLDTIGAVTTGLKVTNRGPEQHRLDRRHRREQAQHRYRANRLVANKRVLLIDDVITTGATVSAAADALAAAGARHISVWALARAP